MNSVCNLELWKSLTNEENGVDLPGTSYQICIKDSRDSSKPWEKPLLVYVIDSNGDAVWSKYYIWPHWAYHRAIQILNTAKKHHHQFTKLMDTQLLEAL